MMKFTDTGGREWVVEFNVDVARQVRDRLGIDLFKILDKSTWERIGDPYNLAEILFIACGAEERGLNGRQFAKALAGEVIEHAAQAFIRAYESFFPTREGREILTRANRMARGRRERAMPVIEQRLNELERADSAADHATSGSSSTGMPAALGSTPAGSPCGSSPRCTPDASGSRDGTPPESAQP